jgi:hypothetical protein
VAPGDLASVRGLGEEDGMRRAILVAAVALVLAGCDGGGSAPPSGGGTSDPTSAPAGDPVAGVWLISRLSAAPDLARAVPLELRTDADGQLTGMQPYSLHGESPCGVNTLAASPVAPDRPPADDAAAARLLGEVPAPLRSAGRVYAGTYTYACPRFGGQAVAVVVALVGDTLTLCQPAVNGPPSCEDYARAVR